VAHQLTDPGCVVNGLLLSDVEGHVEFVAVVSPRDEDEVTLLLVEREVAHVECAVGVSDGGKHPQHLAVRRHDRIRAHTVTETVVDTSATATSSLCRPAYTRANMYAGLYTFTNSQFTAPDMAQLDGRVESRRAVSTDCM